MNVTIDATSLLLDGAGIRTYVYHWLSALQEASRENGSVVSTYPTGVSLGRTPSQDGSSRWTFRLLMVHACNILGDPALRPLLAGADVFHASQHLAKMPRRKNVTATIFDLSCWRIPECHTAANVAATRRYGQTILKACDGLIAISAHARNDAMEILGIPEERIHVIYPGVAEPYFEVASEQAAKTRAKYGLTSPYLLFVGCIEPRKNVPMLIHAYRQLPESLRRDVRMVVAGPWGWEDPEVRKLLPRSGDQVQYLGYVPEPDLPGLFRGAAALVFPSQYEGFGLPVAQALAAGVPVITSNRASLPEVVGDAGLLIDPDSPEELTDAMLRVVSNPELALELASRGKERAHLFHWSACARQSFAFFHGVTGR